MARCTNMVLLVSGIVRGLMRSPVFEVVFVTTGLSASLGLQAEVKRGIIHTAPQVPPYGGGEAPALEPEFFTPAAWAGSVYLGQGGGSDGLKRCGWVAVADLSA